MTLEQRFRKAFEGARGATDAGNAFTVKMGRGGVSFSLDVSDADRLGMLVREARIQRRNGSADTVALVAQAEELIRRVTYLQESLALIEIDRRRCRAVLRSAHPHLDGEAIHYYEIVLDNGRRGGLRRYRWEQGTRGRKAEPANLSVETASRLASDLIEVFSGRK